MSVNGAPVELPKFAQQILADQAIKDRMALLERLAERKAEQATDKQKQVHTFNSILNHQMV